MNDHFDVQGPSTAGQIDRRSVLKALSASPLLFGAPSLFAADSMQGKAAGGKPDWFTRALRRAAERRLPVVAFVVPDAGHKEPATRALERQKARFKARVRSLLTATGAPKPGKPLPGKHGRGEPWFTFRFEDRRARLEVYLQLLLDSRNPDVQELWLDAVYMCAPARLIGAQPDETVVVLASDGRRVGGDIVDLSEAASFVSDLRHLLHGTLTKRARAARTPDFQRTLEQLSDRDAGVRTRARTWLIERAGSHLPAIIEARRGRGPLRRELDAVIAGAYAKAAQPTLAGVLPFGTRLMERMVYDPCPPCGMARVPDASRKMLQLLSK